jgi:hypothetical protein
MAIPAGVDVARVVVPDVVGLSVTEAMWEATVRGVRLEVQRVTEDPAPVPGVVVDQSPAPGARIRRRSAVQVRVLHPPRDTVAAPSAHATARDACPDPVGAEEEGVAEARPPVPSVHPGVRSGRVPWRGRR